MIFAAERLAHTLPVPPEIALLINLGLLWVGAVGTAFTWQRAILLGTKPNGLTDIAAWPFWRHLGCALILLLGLIITLSLAASFGMIVPPTNPFAFVFVILALVGSLAFVSRFGLVLPAAAVAERRLTFRMSWMMTNGNTARLVIGGLLVVVPAFTLSQLLIGLFDGLTWSWSIYVVVRPIMAVASICVVTALGATYLALCYRFFAQRRLRLEDGDDLDELRDAFS